VGNWPTQAETDNQERCDVSKLHEKL
jgi:hypothetical protein